MIDLTRGPLEIAVVGAGVAGVVSAYVLARRHRVTLFERGEEIGGHTHTVTVPEGPDAGTPVDTGFIVHNDRTYPLFRRFIGQLGVATQASDMSFSYHDEATGFCYSGPELGAVFAQRSNALSPRFLRMLLDIDRFGRDARRELAAGGVGPATLGEWLERGGYSRWAVERYVIPMAAAIWSTRPAEVAAYPAESLLRFFANHGLLSLRDVPTWATITGGSVAYLRAFLRAFTGKVRAGEAVRSLRRDENGVLVSTATGGAERFDGVVVATHADEALALLDDPSEDERRLLGAWRYQANRTVLHSDVAVLPPARRAWASWNFAQERGASERSGVSLSYHMNRLQRLSTREQWLVTLNREAPIPVERVVATMDWAHPTYTFASVATQRELPTLLGRRSTWFCGSYFGYGFHEDAVRSAVEVGRSFGIEL